MAAKVSLRQFQQELAQRLSSAKTEQTAAARLGVQCGSQNWLVALEDAGAVLPVPEVLSVPLTKPWYVGVANIRGGLFSVVDFSAYAGGDATVRGSDARLILTGPRFGINAALLVSRMLGLRNARDLQARHDGDERVSNAAWFGPVWHETLPTAASAAGAAPQVRMWRELKMEHLLEAPEFLNVGV